jgi:hypothetical protein
MRRRLERLERRNSSPPSPTRRPTLRDEILAVEELEALKREIARLEAEED